MGREAEPCGLPYEAEHGTIEAGRIVVGYRQHGAAAHPADQPLAVARRHPAEEQDIAVATRHYCGSGDPPHDQVPAAGQLGGDRIAREPRSAELAQAASNVAPPVRPAPTTDDPPAHNNGSRPRRARGW